MKIKSIDTSKDLTLKDNIFKVAMNSQVVYQSVVAEMNNARQGTSSTKNRSLAVSYTHLTLPTICSV